MNEKLFLVKINQFKRKVYLERYIFAVFLLCFKTFAFQEQDTINSRVFIIKEGVQFVGLGKDSYIIINKKANIYVLPDIIFKNKVLLFANINIISKTHFSIVDKQSKIKVKVKENNFHKISKKHKNKSLSQINSIPINGRNSSSYLFSNLKFCVTPTTSKFKKYYKCFFVDTLFSFHNKNLIIKYKQQTCYRQSIKAFTLKILLYNRPPPVV